MTSCAYAAVEMIDALESGVKPWPVFFAGDNCDIGQWPPKGQALEPHFYNAIFDLRANACPASPATGAMGVLTQENCPLPAIQTALIPPNLRLVFHTVISSLTPAIRDPGIFILEPENPNISKSIFKVDKTNASKSVWGSLFNGRGAGSMPCAYTGTNYDASFDQAAKAYFDGDGGPYRAKHTNLSCGVPFWPSLASVDQNLGLTGINWNMLLSTSGTVGTCTGGTEAEPNTFCTTATNMGTPNNVALQTVTNLAGVLKCPANTLGSSYTFGDCVTHGLNAQNNSGSVCNCESVHDGQPPHCKSCNGDNQPCHCDPIYQSHGNVGNLEINEVASDWTTQQFLYCTGIEKLNFGGINIQRYGNGSKSCDPIVESFCTSSSNLLNPSYKKACSCVIEQKRIEAQFSGLELPVNCFSSVCSDDDPTVYKTSQQSIGCSAKICKQILDINGQSISEQGYQSVLCDGVTYNTESFKVSGSPVPLVTKTGLSSGGIHLGIAFYISIGVLVIMVVLTVTWGIRKFVLQRRSQKAGQKKLETLLEKKLNIVA